ncbi:DUF5658 family protein [Sediminibacillus halophilus]|uniref:DUF5658 domain-containing protein n=1 Tax=Sediminibacillus halophilus TaxID=482461 RepID=A0A1G9VC34_9BACI|nr:DUF5658 family protein [Sediminibacillus halophilus]SDM69617.1 hypothetical protein SAMN05216244_3220 [Sediminibacillus halophilus]
MKTCFMYLALLNLLDGVITFLGIKYEYISEANPLMKSLYQSGPLFFLLVKLLLSTMLIGFCVIQKLPRSLVARVLSCAAALLYSVICLMHGFWLWQLT